MIFCTVSILIGILQMILPQKEQTGGIKLVMALYIIITLIQPIRQIQWQQLLWQPVPTAQQASFSLEVDMEQLIEQKAKQNLQQQLQKEFDKQQLDVIVKEVVLDYQAREATAQVEKIILQGSSQKQAEQTVKQLFEQDTAVEWEEKEKIS